MKKLIVILFLSFITIYTGFAQSPLNKGNKQFNAGVGFSGWGVPIYLGMDFGVSPDVSLGFEGSFRSYNQNFTGTKYNSSIFGFSGNANYHFNRVLEIPSNWDFYAGLNLGFYVWNTSNDYPGNSASRLGLGGQIGGRYFVSDRFGLNLEFGGGNAFSGGKFGITLIL